MYCNNSWKYIVFIAFRETLHSTIGRTTGSHNNHSSRIFSLLSRPRNWESCYSNV